MKKRITLIKSLLIAATLLVGGASPLWADGSKRTLNAQDYELVTASDWTSFTAVCDFKTGDATYGNYAQMWASGSGNRCANKKVALAYTPDQYTTANMSVKGYNIEFDMQLRSGNVSNRSVSQFLISSSVINPANNTAYDGTDYFFSLSQPTRNGNSYDNTWFINDLSNTTDQTVTIDNSKWYHYAFVVTAASVSYSITEVGKKEPAATGSKAVEEMPTIASFFTLIGRGGGLLNFDNLDIYDYSNVKVATAPTFTLKAVTGNNRVYTIANSNGEGKIYYTTAPAEDAPAIGDDAYTSVTDATKDVEFSEAGNYYAYVVLDDNTTTSTVTTEAVTVGAITLPTPTYSVTNLGAGYEKTFTITAPNNVLLTPTVKLSYVFTPEGGVAQTPVNMEGNTINATEAGTYVVTSSADGYTSSTVEIDNTKAYKLTKTIDFSALVDEDFDDLWKNSSVGLRDYWNVRLSVPTTVTIKQLKEPTAESAQTALDGITVTNYQERQPEIVIGYGLYTPYEQLSGNGNNCNFTVNGGTSDNIIVYNGWSNYGSGTFTTVQAGDVAYALYRYDTILKTIKVYEEMTEDYAAVTIGEDGFASFSSEKALDFSSSSIKAYIATAASNGVVFMKRVYKVPANTGLVVQGSSENVLAYDGATEDVSSNLLKPGTGANVAASTNGAYHYAFAKQGTTFGFYNLTAPTMIETGKAYLKTTTALATEARLVFVDETTGIANVNTQMNDVKGIFNLNGQRIAAPQKGLFIINGKKVMVK